MKLFGENRFSVPADVIRSVLQWIRRWRKMCCICDVSYIWLF